VSDDNCNGVVHLYARNVVDGSGNTYAIKVEWDVNDPEKQADFLVGHTQKYQYPTLGQRQLQVYVTDMFQQRSEPYPAEANPC
jgi:hypothetical protein